MIQVFSPVQDRTIVKINGVERRLVKKELHSIESLEKPGHVKSKPGKKEGRVEKEVKTRSGKWWNPTGQGSGGHGKMKIKFEGKIYDSITQCSKITGIDKAKLSRCANGFSTVLKVEKILSL